VFEIGPEKILLVLGAALLFLGPKELPAAARKLAAGLRQVRSLQDTVRGEMMAVLDVDSPATATSPAAPPGSTEPVEPTSFI
jgi:Sec-independent protein translocase protein TatA